MTNFQKFKHEARRAEQRSDWARAIDLYQRALDTDEDMADLSLYNRIGDLHLRQGQNDEAVGCYERAVERYADHQMDTSAIALCNKILRIAPGRTSVYRRLGGLHARTGLLAEGRGNCLAYVCAALEAGDTDDAREAVEEFVELTDDEEIRLRFADELEERGHPAAALEQLRAVYRIRKQRGSDAADLLERIHELSPGESPEDDGAFVDVPDAATVESAEGPVVLAERVARRIGANGNSPIFESAPPPPGPEPRRAGGDGLDEVRRLHRRFRGEVRDALEEGDLTIRYDLGVNLMMIGLLDEAIEEFRAALAVPALAEAANARIGECLVLLGADSSSASAPDTLRAPDSDRPPEREPVSEPVIEVDANPPDRNEPGPNEPMREPEHDVGPVSEAEEGDDALQGHFFRARLAQYRIRRAEDRHAIDHAAHLDLGAAYVEMDLNQEAVRELGVALRGPRAVAGRAARALRRLAADPGTPPEIALSVFDLLATPDTASIAAKLGAELAEAWGRDHPSAARLRELRRHLADTVDELPALESMFPALRDAAGNELTESAGEPAPAPELDETTGEPAPEPEEAAATHDTLEADLARAAALVEAGNADEAADVLGGVLERLEGERRTRDALVVLNRLLDVRPDDAELHQQRTELALMLNDRTTLLSAYAGLGACLRRQDSDRRARVAYGRMLDVDPDNSEAKQAIEDIDAAEVRHERQAAAQPTREAMPAEDNRAEFDALLEGLDGVGADGEPAGEAIRPEEWDERAVAEESDGAGNEDAAARSRYDLGLAFRQMGMWDEAARELRAALDGGILDRLAALEALAECLVRDDRSAEAAALLERELRSDDDEQQVGLLYFLGFALQTLGRDEEARTAFGRVEAASPGYRDASRRLSELSL